MKTNLTRLIPLAAVLIALTVPFLSRDAAQAEGGTCTAVLAGLENGKKTPAELVVMNTSPTQVVLDLLIRDPAGTVLINRPAEITVGARATAIVALDEQLSRGVGRSKDVYRGMLSVELTGDAPFGETAFLVHATQYFGKRKKPKGAVIFEPLFLSDDP